MTGPRDDEAMTASMRELCVETSTSRDTKTGQHENGGDAAAADDYDIWDDGSDSPSHASTLDREWIHRRNQFQKMGYRDGITEGQKDAAQDGFNIGFRQSVTVGYKWGLVRGITSAIGSLPESLKVKLLPDIQCREKLQDLYNSMQEVSADNALQMFNEIIPRAIHPSGSDQPHLTSGEDATLDSNMLRRLWKDPMLLLHDCPDIKLSEEFVQDS